MPGQLNRLPGIETSKSYRWRSPALSVYIEINAIMTTIRFRNIAYNNTALFFPRAYLFLPPGRPPPSYYMRYYRSQMKVYAEMDDFPVAIERREELLWV